jgi:hypothetical protein
MITNSREMTSSASITPPPRGCTASFVAFIFLLCPLAWWWAFQPPIPQRDGLVELSGTVDHFHESTVRQGRTTQATWTQLDFTLHGQTTPLRVEPLGYEEHFQRAAFAQAAAEKILLKFLAEKQDTETKANPIRVREVRSTTAEVFTLENYCAALKTRRISGIVVAALVTAFCCFLLVRLRQGMATSPRPL